MTSVPTQLLLERFPVLRTGDVPGERVGDCPCIHEAGEATFPIRDLGDGTWSIQVCDLGCMPQAIWDGAEVIDRPQPGEDREEEPKTRFRLESLTDLLLEEIPPIKWLLAPYIPAASFGELVGPPGKGKTTFMAWMIMQMAMAGHLCAIIEEEGSRGGLQRLLRRALAAVGPEAAGRVSFMHAQGVDIAKPGEVAELAVLLQGYDFVLFDSFAMVTPGLDEDKAQAVGPLVKLVKWLRDSTGVAPWFNHHSGKSKWQPGEKPKLGDGRGSSALPGALDAELSMKPIEKQAEGLIQFELYVTKMREADDQVKPQLVSIARTGEAATVEMEDLGVLAPASDLSDPVEAVIELIMLSKNSKGGLIRLPINESEAMTGTNWAKMLNTNKKNTLEALPRCARHGILGTSIRLIQGQECTLYFKL